MARRAVRLFRGIALVVAFASAAAIFAWRLNGNGTFTKVEKFGLGGGAGAASG